MRSFIFIVISLFFLQSYADTSIWSVSNGKNTIYLGGTIHILKPTDYPLPQEYETAYKKVGWLVFETDINAIESPEFIQQFAQQMMLPKNDHLQKHLSPEVYQRLVKEAVKRQWPMEHFNRMRPQMVALTISIEAIQQLGYTAQGVDSHFNNKAKRDSKITSHLESAQQQLKILTNMASENEDELLIQTLDDLPDIKNLMQKLADAWRTGNRLALIEHGLLDMDKEFPEMYQDMIKQRNDNWMPIVENLIKHPEEKMVLVGALHLIGKDGLLQRLEKKGYTIKQL